MEARCKIKLLPVGQAAVWFLLITDTDQTSRVVLLLLLLFSLEQSISAHRSTRCGSGHNVPTNDNDNNNNNNNQKGPQPSFCNMCKQSGNGQNQVFRRQVFPRGH